jgi:hypothetical protein
MGTILTVDNLIKQGMVMVNRCGMWQKKQQRHQPFAIALSTGHGVMQFCICTLWCQMGNAGNGTRNASILAK